MRCETSVSYMGVLRVILLSRTLSLTTSLYYFDLANITHVLEIPVNGPPVDTILDCKFFQPLFAFHIVVMPLDLSRRIPPSKRGQRPCIYIVVRGLSGHSWQLSETLFNHITKIWKTIHCKGFIIPNVHPAELSAYKSSDLIYKMPCRSYISERQGTRFDQRFINQKN